MFNAQHVYVGFRRKTKTKSDDEAEQCSQRKKILMSVTFARTIRRFVLERIIRVCAVPYRTFRPGFPRFHGRSDRVGPLFRSQAGMSCDSTGVQQGSDS